MVNGKNFLGKNECHNDFLIESLQSFLIGMTNSRFENTSQSKVMKQTDQLSYSLFPYRPLFGGVLLSGVDFFSVLSYFS